MPLLQLIEKMFKVLLAFSLVGVAVSMFNKDKMPDPGFYDRQVLKEPRQYKTQVRPFSTQAGDQQYRITPLFDYELHGVVVSQHDSDEFSDIYHHDDWQDFLNIKDICVIWGSNVSSGVYRDMAFNNTTWTCWFSWPDSRVGGQFRHTQLSNNHLLADNAEINQAIMSAQPGDHVRFKGFLANYANPGNGFTRGTSTVRNDRGNGACETVYVKNFEIVQQANAGWRRFYQFCKWSAIISLIGFLAMTMVTPVTRR